MLTDSLFDAILSPVLDAEWDDLCLTNATAERALRSLATPGSHLYSLILASTRDDRLLAKWERFKLLDKLVLYDDVRGRLRLRLHVFHDVCIDQPHNHRWSFSSLILRGGYTHQVYGPFLDKGEVNDNVPKAPLLVRYEKPGTVFTMHHSMVHSLIAEPNTVSLVLRGPAVKMRALMVDAETGRSWWHHGADTEPVDERLSRAMTSEDVLELVDKLAWLREA